MVTTGKVTGLFVRTNNKPYRWTCVCQCQGDKYADNFYRLWELREEAYGSDKVQIIETSKVQLTEKERLAL